MQNIKDCEGGILETHWCMHCLIRATRIQELLLRFEKFNKGYSKYPRREKYV